MNYSIRKSENILFVVKIIATILVWFAIIAFISIRISQPESLVTLITVLIYVAFILLYILFYRIYLVAYMKGQGVCVSETQFSEVFAKYCEIAKQLELKKIPPLFILQGGGILNAFAIRLSGRNYIAIYSDIFALDLFNNYI
ncbi:MAG: hypothetical protein LBU66_00145, partial [Treponema sp.]|nr:hypothetical protein [Treponema sp.]